MWLPQRRPRRIGGRVPEGQRVAEIHDQLLGAERQAGRVGRTNVLASAALGASEEVEDLFPVETGVHDFVLTCNMWWW
jgi:hypothetical protein